MPVTTSQLTSFPTGIKVGGQLPVLNSSAQYTIAQVNAGVTIFPAVDRMQYRVVGMIMIAVGGNAGGATGVYIKGTQAASVVNLVAATVGALTQSTVLLLNSANVTVLADAASLGLCDVNTAITFIKNGNDLTTATHIFLSLSVALSETTS